MKATEEDILLLWRRQLPPDGAISFRGDHDADKLARVCAVYGLPKASEVLVLYDDTVFGSAEEGFVVTAEGFGFKRISDEPKWIAFVDLAPEQVQLSESSFTTSVRVCGDVPGLTAANPEFHRRLAVALGQMAQLAKGTTQRGVYRTASPQLTQQRGMREVQLPQLLALVSEIFEVDSRLFIAPDIPARKLERVTELYGIRSAEHVALIYDDTLMGSAKDGLVITTKRLGFKEAFETPVSIWFETLTHEDIVVSATGQLTLRGSPQDWHALDERKLAEAIRRIADHSNGSPDLE